MILSFLITFLLSACGGDKREYSFPDGSEETEESDNGNSSKDAITSQDDLGDYGYQESQESNEISETTDEDLDDPSEGHTTILYLTERLKINHRYIVPKIWIESNILPNITVEDQKVVIGVPKDTADWSSVGLVEGFWASFRLSATSASNQHLSRIKTDDTDQTVTVSSITDAIYDYAVEWDGVNLHILASTPGDLETQPSISDGGVFDRVASFSDFSSAQQGKPRSRYSYCIQSPRRHCNIWIRHTADKNPMER